MNDDPKYKLPVEDCCSEFADVVMMNDIRQGVIRDGDEMFIVWSDGDCTPLRYCPCCGKRFVKGPIA